MESYEAKTRQAVLDAALAYVLKPNERTYDRLEQAVFTWERAETICGSAIDEPDPDDPPQRTFVWATSRRRAEDNLP